MTGRALCTPNEYKTGDPVESYRDYYLGEKMSFAEWNYSGTPEFVKEAESPEKRELRQRKG